MPHIRQISTGWTGRSTCERATKAASQRLGAMGFVMSFYPVIVESFPARVLELG